MTATRRLVRWGATAGAAVAGVLFVVLAASAASVDGRRGSVVFGIAGVLLLIAGLVFGSGVYPAGLVAIGVSFAFALAGHQVGAAEVITATALLLLVDQLAGVGIRRGDRSGRARWCDQRRRCLRVVAIVALGASVERAGALGRRSPGARRPRRRSDRHRCGARCARPRRVPPLGALGRAGAPPPSASLLQNAPHLARFARENGEGDDDLMAGQRTAVRVDPVTGLKVFDTRAAPEGNITGSGYAVLADESLKVLPEQPAGAVFDAVEQAKYRAYKEARRGAADYIAMEGDFAKYLRDVYSTEPVPREALTDECEVVVVGAGFAGLLLWHKLTQAGFRDVRFCEKGGDVGGTWYWNRYPGIACDVEAYSYLPLLEEMGYVPSMKFASGFEIYEYCQAMAERFGFYERCLFHTTVERTEWEEATGRWTVFTDRGDAMQARFVVLANGILTTPKLARIRGMETFQGDSFHTSRWNYDVDLHGKRVGIIGTGATAVQAIPELAKVAGELFVFQRTPSTIDVRDQRETTEDERETWANEPGWARARRARFAKISTGTGGDPGERRLPRGHGSRTTRSASSTSTSCSPEELVEKQLGANFRIMEQIRARVDAIVDDPRTADALKPYYPYGCKRPTFHDEYLPTFNLPHVHLVDTAPMGVAEINERGVVHDDVEYPLDVLIYATGFQWMATSTFNMVVGRGGRSLSDKWQTEGTKTFLGLHTQRLPQPVHHHWPPGRRRQLQLHRLDRLAHRLRRVDAEHHARGGDAVVDVREEDEEAWATHCREADIISAPLRDCLSYYNGHGEAAPGSLAYYGGTNWKRRCRDAQESLAPYVFQS